MNLKISIVFIFLSCCLFLGCSGDQSNNQHIGTWELVSYSVGISADLNNDNIANENLLKEFGCENLETMVFEDEVVSNNKSFNPEVKITLVNAENNEYAFSVKCDNEGFIGFASDYLKQGDTITIQNKVSILKDDTLTRVLSGNIEVYNAAGTEIIERRDLTLVYKKQK